MHSKDVEEEEWIGRREESKNLPHAGLVWYVRVRWNDLIPFLPPEPGAFATHHTDTILEQSIGRTMGYNTINTGTFSD